MKLKELLPLIDAQVNVTTSEVKQFGYDTWQSYEYNDLLELHGEKSIAYISIFSKDTSIFLELK